MIRPLRQYHRRLFVMLGVLLPVAFVMGVAARKPAPTMTALPGELSPASQEFTVTEWERSDLFVKTPVKVRLLRGRKDPNRLAVELSAAMDFVKPDLIVYWIAGTPNITEAPPDEAHLLGAFGSSGVLSLPPDATSASGVMLLYSLANQEVVEVSKPFGLRKP